ncbi:MAG: hypothetical protein JW984_12600 [Deltaproteobacteria bacterium]|uniref:Uncharacterized protein n=1 Tax=Candidatus Zymogenus saltonus TaxID=2844893 RepID=A0A9D8KGH3_9DELT|nr:hypothetical protein [Candidatus Zymogenus saltonus]
MKKRNHSLSFTAAFVVVFFFGASLFLTGAPPASARTVKAKVKVVNISYFDKGADITDADLIRLAIEETEGNENLFPKINGLTLKSGGEKLPYSPGVAIPAAPFSFYGGPDPKKRLEFISISSSRQAGKYDIAVVGSDGSIRKYDKEIVIDNVNKIIRTYETIEIKGEDVILLFIRDIKVIQFKDVRPEGHDQTPG